MMVDSQSLVSMWVCLILSIVFIAIRGLLRRLRGQSFTRGDYWCFSAAAFILGRLLANHFLLLYGSTRILSSERRIELSNDGGSVEASQIITGSKLVLVTRSLMICVLWSLKMAVFDLLARLIMKMPYERKLLYIFWSALGTTFVASFVTIFVGCTPFARRWQIYPNPGNCVIGNIWLYTYEICNILTDVLLMAVPCSLILSVRIPTMQRLRILFLFSIGVFLIAVSVIRIILGYGSHAQRAHTLWASLEILFATIVAVTPNIYALTLNRYENDSYANSGAGMTNTAMMFSSPDDRGRWAARVWTELEEGERAQHQSHSSVEGILVETRYESRGSKI